MRNKSIKGIIGLIIFTIIALSTTMVKAVPQSFNWHSDGKGEFATTIVEGMWVMCIEKGGHLKETTYDKGEKEGTDYICWRCLEDAGEWDRTEFKDTEGDGKENLPSREILRLKNTGWPKKADPVKYKYQSEFTIKEQKDVNKYQDVLYVLKHTDDIDVAQRIMWVLGINEGRHLGIDSLRDTEKDIYNEAVEYKKYYEEKEKNAGKEFTPKDVTDLSKVKVSVDKKNDTYTAGPFAVSYLDNYYVKPNGERINFGEMSELLVKNEKGEDLELVEIQDEKGKSISARDYKYPQKEEKFYVKFKATKPSKSISLDMGFKYFKKYTGTLYEYEGRIYQWYWQIDSKTKDDGCTIPHKTAHGGIENQTTTYAFNLRKLDLGEAQKLLAYGMDVEEETGTARLTIGKDIPEEPEEKKIPMIAIYKECSTHNEPLYGAEFNITLAINGQDSSGSKNKTITLGKKTDDQGLAKISTEDIEQYGIDIGTFTGTIDATIKETKAPEGHHIKNETSTMRIVLNKGVITNCTGSSKTEIDNDMGGKSVAKITVYNDEIPPTIIPKQPVIYIYKESSDNTQALFGAEFEVTLKINGKELKFSRKTDTNGLARITAQEIKERGVDLSEFTGTIDVIFKETNAPTNYIITNEISTMKLILNNGVITSCSGSSTTNLKTDSKGNSIAKITIYNAKKTPPPVIDITMNISGKVFLDKDQGKVNEGNNQYDDGEGLEGIEVTLYEVNNNKVVLEQNVMHQHIGNSSQYGGCYTKPVEHKHSGSETVQSSCYNQATHTHIGSAEEGGPGTCFEEPVYHMHEPECYNPDGQLICGKHEHEERCFKVEEITKCVKEIHEHSYKTGCYPVKCQKEHEHTKKSCFDLKAAEICGKEEHKEHNWKEGCYPLKCEKTDCKHDKKSCYSILSHEILDCQEKNLEPDYWKLTCNEEVKYIFTCNKEEGKDIDYYEPDCGQTTSSVESITKLANPVLTDSNGYYEFTNIDAQKDYYVKFTYNGMLYTNVQYNVGSEVVSSKATEDYQGGSNKNPAEYMNNNRANFNNTFAEIGSYPTNYKTTDFENGQTIYNKVYLQEEIADLFREVSKMATTTNGDERAAYLKVLEQHEDENEIRSKIQFVADCRINAYTVKTYAIPDEFVIDDSNQRIAGKDYSPIYSRQYDQTNVNLGIKNRPTVDLALYKDAFKAEVKINGKSEIYEYDSRKGGNAPFSVGVSESDYLNGLRNKYLAVSGEEHNNANNEIKDKITKSQIRDVESDKYEIEMRAEEVANGQSSVYGNKSGIIGGNNSYTINNNYETLQGIGNENRLQVYLTYKIAVENQSGTTAAITEIVDYYDPNYEYAGAYVGDENGVKQGDVTYSENSMYANNGANMYKSKNGTYKTMYLRPNTETRLHNNNKRQYIFVTLKLVGKDPNNKDAGNTLCDKLLNKQNFETSNLAEINGYKTYNALQGTSTPGLIDIDSNPGNIDISNIGEFTDNNIKNYPGLKNVYEDDTSRAPVFIYKVRESRTLAGTVFEDKTTGELKTEESRNGNGELGNDDTKVKDVIVQLVEIKNNNMVVRAQTRTNSDGWYGFIGFVPGDYTVRFIYGSDDTTAMNTTTAFGKKGSNVKSYNGQDFQSTIMTVKQGRTLAKSEYNTDQSLKDSSTAMNKGKNGEEQLNIDVPNKTEIYKYNNEGNGQAFYWYTQDDKKSDAQDDAARKQQVIDYSKNEYGREITNHKAEVFNSYQNDDYYKYDTENETGYYPTMTKDLHATLASELERRTYRYAYTPQIPVEVEYATTTIKGNYKEGQKYEHNITGVDFGIVERPRSELVLDQDVQHIKVTAADGVTVLFDTEKGVYNLQWKKGDNANKGMVSGRPIEGYDKKQLINIIMDNELISGAKLEITYKFTITNNGEAEATTRAKRIINYVANNLNFEIADNKDKDGNALWEVVKLDDMQNDKKSTLVNNRAIANEERKQLDISTQTTTLQATAKNPLTKALKPGEEETATLKLTKVLSSESSADDLAYSNMAEIVEIDNSVGRYDHGAIPGNQSLEKQPQEHDTVGSSRTADKTSKETPPDGEVIVTPPTGSKYIYYTLGFTITIILAAGVYLIKRKVIDKK